MESPLQPHRHTVAHASGTFLIVCATSQISLPLLAASTSAKQGTLGVFVAGGQQHIVNFTTRRAKHGPEGL